MKIMKEDFNICLSWPGVRVMDDCNQPLTICQPLSGAKSGDNLQSGERYYLGATNVEEEKD